MINRTCLIVACLLGACHTGAGMAQTAPDSAPPPGSEPAATPLQRDGLPDPQPQVEATLPHYLQWRTARFVDWLSDGSLLISTRFGDTEQIHRVHAPLGMREQVSFAPGGVSAGLAQPYANDTLIYLEALRGGQRARWFLQHLDSHELVPLTDGQHRDGPGLWAHDGRHLAFSSQRINDADSEIYEIDASVPTGVPRLLAGAAGYRWRIYDWSADDRHVLLGRAASTGSPDSGETDPRPMDLYELDVASGDLSAVSYGSHVATAVARTAGKRKPHVGGPALPVRGARYAPDGHGLVLLTDDSGPGGSGAGSARFAHLVYLDPRNSEWRSLAASPAHDVGRFDLSADGRYIAYSIHDDTTDRLMVLDQVRKLDSSVGQLPPGSIGRFKFDASGQRLALSVESARAPGDVYVYEPQSNALTPWTHSEAGPLDTQSFVQPERLNLATWDRLESGKPRPLQSLLYRPLSQTAAHPVLIYLSGAPGTPARPRFDPFVQYLVNDLGFVVVAPHLRPATPADDEPGQDAIRDVGSVLVWIGLQRQLDRDRVAVMGEGFGAYVALQSLADYGDRLRGGVAAFAPHGSALAHSPAIRRPLLLVQGLDSPGAPAYELQQLRLRLRSEGVEVQSLEAPGEGFGFVHKRHRDAYQMSTANFLAQLLR
jgi:dipeptidyl aminopeptidase/acylaminoacyl peptidase